jgi:hypothetical protein
VGRWGVGIVFRLFSSAAALSEVWGWLGPFFQGVITFYALCIFTGTILYLLCSSKYSVTVKPERGKYSVVGDPYKVELPSVPLGK